MNYLYRFLALAFIAGLVASGANSLSLGSTGESAQGQQQQQQQQQQQHAATGIPSTPSVTGAGPQVANATEKGENRSNTGRYLGSVGSYEQPQQSYEVQQSYVAPVQQSYQQSYVQPQQTYQQQSYVQPIQSYQQQSYVQPIQSYQQQSYVQPQQTYQQQSYVQPQVYEQPIVQTYSTPVVNTYQQNYTSSYVAPIQQSYQQQSYVQPQVSTYVQPQQSYQQSYSNYSTPIVQQSYVQPQQSYQQTSYVQPQVSSYSNYSTQSYVAPVQQSYQQQSYVQPQVSTYVQPQQSYQQSYSNYSTPIVQQSYVQPQQSYQQTSYVQPQIYSNYSTQSYQQPIYSNYSTQSYVAPVQQSYQQSSYVAPVQQTYQQQSYVQPQVYEQPKQEIYQAPVTTSYSTPIVQNYTTPSYQQQSYVQPQQTYQQQSYVQPQQTYQTPIVETYQQQSYVQPQVSTYQQSYVQPQQTYQQQSYVQPQQTYQQQSYVQPQVSTYVQPQQTYQQQSYVQPQQSYVQQPIYQQSGYQQGTSGVFKRQLKDSNELGAPSNMTAGKSTLIDGDMMSTSDSIAVPTFARAPITSQVIPQQQQQYRPIIRQQQQQYQYLDTQPEFTQSWADYPHPPGYLPQAYRSIQYYIPYIPIPTQTYGRQQQQLSPQSLGYGYVTWSGPIDPKSFYTQYHLPYYYKYPRMSPFYPPNPYRQQIVQQQRLYPIPALVKSVAVTATVSYQQQRPLLKVSGYGKRSLSGHEAAPYQMLVDHLAAASEKEAVFANVSSIECPSKPSDYVCPQILDAKNKEELKKKICEYETVLTGTITLVPDTEKAQTRCGAIKIEKPLFKNEEDNTELANKMAVVFGKGCQLKQLYESQTGQKLDSSEPQAHMLFKSSIPSSTKFILADGANVDLLNAALISKDELATMFKQCPKAA